MKKKPKFGSVALATAIDRQGWSLTCEIPENWRVSRHNYIVPRNNTKTAHAYYNLYYIKFTLHFTSSSHYMSAAMRFRRKVWS